MKKKTPPPPVSDINVTPMVDVMLVILIIFMVITPMLNKGKNVDLVKTKNSVLMKNADKEDAVMVAITRDGRAWLGSDQTDPAALPSKVKDLLTSHLDKTVYIKADMRSPYAKVVDVVDNLRAGGVDQLGLITEVESKDKQNGPAPAGNTPAGASN